MAEAFSDAQVRTWREEGWVLIPGLVPTDEIDAALDDLWRLVPRPEEFHADEGDTRQAAFEAASGQRGLFPREPAAADELVFRDRQFLGRALFPWGGSGRLDRLAVHPNLIAFAEAALESSELRLYQMALWAKYTGVVNYAQPLHQDQNHSVVPPRMEPGWWHMEGFLYLCDVGEDEAPTHVVDRSESLRLEEAGDVDYRTRSIDEAPALYAAQKAAVGPRGSYLAYRPDVWHRGVDLTRPGGSRFLLGLSFKLANQDWIGYENVQPRSTSDRFVRFVEGCGPRELALFGVPLPGHPYWTAATLDGMAARYPGLDLEPWRAGQV